MQLTPEGLPRKAVKRAPGFKGITELRLAFKAAGMKIKSRAGLFNLPGWNVIRTGKKKPNVKRRSRRGSN